jgi:Bacterial protein of unknown function (DUF924)
VKSHAHFLFTVLNCTLAGLCGASLVVHKQALGFSVAPGIENNLNFECRQFTILERLKRYPHRNTILGRVSTPEELAFAGAGVGGLGMVLLLIEQHSAQVL